MNHPPSKKYFLFCFHCNLSSIRSFQMLLVSLDGKLLEKPKIWSHWSVPVTGSGGNPDYWPKLCEIFKILKFVALYAKKTYYCFKQSIQTQKMVCPSISEGVLSKMWPLRTGSGQSGSGNQKTFKQFFFFKIPMCQTIQKNKCGVEAFFATLYFQNPKIWPRGQWEPVLTVPDPGNSGHMTFLLNLLKSCFSYQNFKIP